MTDGLASQLNAMLVAQVVAQDADASQLNSMVVGIFPSENGEVSQLNVMLPIEADMDARVSQLNMLIVAGGRIAYPSLKVATFTLDGHDLFVVFLGSGETLLYDLYSKRWTNWGNLNSTRWRHRTLANWAGAVGISPGAQIVTGDDTYGTQYFLDPDYPYDDHPLTGAENRETFTRIAQGQVSHRGRDPIDCFGVELTGSFGAVYDLSLTAVTLEYSDDAGNTYDAAGTLDIAEGDFTARVEWPSLGQINAPGRLFKITDDGALARIDSLDMFNAGS